MKFLIILILLTALPVVLVGLLIAYAPKLGLELRRDDPVRYGLFSAMAGASLTALAYIYLIFQSKSSTAAIGLIGTPLFAFVGGVVFFIAVWAVAALLLFSRSANRTRFKTASLQLPIAVFVIGYGVYASVPIVKSEWRVHEVSRESVSAEELWIFFNDPVYGKDRFVLRAIAKNRNTSSELLLAIAGLDMPSLHDKQSGLRNFVRSDTLAVMRHVIRHKAVTAEALVVLSESKNNYVLSDVARHKLTPKDVIEKFTKKEGYLTDWGLAANENTPPEKLTEMSKSQNEYTRHSVARNTSTPPATLTELSRDKNMFVRRYVAMNPSTPTETLWALSKDREGEVRFYVTINKAASDELLRSMLGDPEDRTADTAKQMLERRELMRRLEEAKKR